MVPRIAGRKYARGTMYGINFKTGIICKTGDAIFLKNVSRFLNRVPF
jgi:hypothetical protein